MTKTNAYAEKVSDGRRSHGRRGIAKGIGGTLLCLVVVATLASVSGCQKDPDDGRKMSQSSGEFSDGYKDGRRDALQSWTDVHAGWMWLWMTEEQYRHGYDRGWDDGRTEKGLRDKQDKQDKDRDKGSSPLSNE